MCSVSNLECINRLKGSMNALGTLLDGDIVGYPGGGSLASGLKGVDEEGGANCEGYTTPYNNSPFPGALLVTMATTTT